MFDESNQEYEPAKLTGCVAALYYQRALIKIFEHAVELHPEKPNSINYKALEIIIVSRQLSDHKEKTRKSASLTLEEIRRNVTFNITTPGLKNYLKRLTEHGYMGSHKEDNCPTNLYNLTDKGRDLYKLAVKIMNEASQAAQNPHPEASRRKGKRSLAP